MPEGPEVWREAAAIARVVEDEPIVRIEFVWPAVAQHAKSVARARIDRVRPRGKAMTLAFSTGFSLVTHNQLYGEWIVRKTAPPTHRKALRVLIETARGVAMLYSATDIHWLPTPHVDAHPYIAKLGPDALDTTTTVASVRARLVDNRFRQRSLAALLLDQGFVAGLGNYLRSDILFFARVQATLKPAQCTDDELDALAHAIVEMPRQSFRTRGITNDHAFALDLKREGWSFGRYRHWVFDREGEACHVCATTISRVAVGGRNVFHCYTCQRAAAQST
jgi:endonuclease VIII